MWKTVYDSVKGTSHEDSQQPCQDACRVVELEVSGEVLLVACAADGAGSASHSDEGSRIACDIFIESLEGWEVDFGAEGADCETQAKNWIQGIRERIESRAAELSVATRQLACTFLGAVVGNSNCLFIQIGDGAIIRGSNDGYQAVFWPQSGEYANTTNFVTDPTFSDHLVVKQIDERIDEIALFTDGLERLILKFDDKSVHEPFLTPFFNSLRSAEDPEAYFEPLRNFLNSQAVNERTDDDKTLILATRLE